jgi:hypothetical protein
MTKHIGSSVNISDTFRMPLAWILARSPIILTKVSMIFLAILGKCPGSTFNYTMTMSYHNFSQFSIDQHPVTLHYRQLDNYPRDKTTISYKTANKWLTIHT